MSCRKLDLKAMQRCLQGPQRVLRGALVWILYVFSARTVMALNVSTEKQGPMKYELQLAS